MTRLWIMSDLHQEWRSNAYDPTRHAPADFDVVVVAGDVDTPGTSAIDRLADWFPGTPVVYVAGNHDFYIPTGEAPFTLEDMRSRMRDRAAARGIRFLDDTMAVIGGVRFIGGTLWTDMRLGTTSQGHAWNTSRRGMNDYRCIRRRRTGPHHNLRPEDTVDLHRQTRLTIEAWLRQPFDGETVVVTHHAPSVYSLPDEHMDLRWCYASRMHDILTDIRGPDWWIHGHVHSHSEYRVGRTGVVANPRGHVGEVTGFVPDFVLDFEEAARRMAEFRADMTEMFELHRSMETGEEES